MYEELLPGIFRIEVPLPNNPLRALNAYLVKGHSRNLLIDNGFNTHESHTALHKALEALNVNLVETDFFLTHLHSDHNGLTHSLLKSAISKVMCSMEDGTRINRFILEEDYWKEMFVGLVRHGFPQAEMDELYFKHPGKIYASPKPLNFTYVEDGDSFSYGRYSFNVIETPGHTPGHVVLYESSSKTLFAGDHILGSISPNITRWDGVADSLGDYLRSLDKMKGYQIDRSLPGHRGIVEDTQARISELEEHHQARLDEICMILKKQPPLSAYEVAARMRWSLKGITWSEFKVQQKCFAAGEALAHLTHLAVLGRAVRIDEGKSAYFALK